MKRMLALLIVLLLVPLSLHAQGTAPIVQIVYSPDGARAASLDTDGIVRVWDGRAPRLITRIAANALAIALPDAETLVGLTRAGRLYRWTIETRARTQLADLEAAVDFFAFDEQGTRLAVSMCTADIEPCPAFALRLVDIAGGTLSDPLMTSASLITAAAFHPSGDLITVGTDDGNLVMLPIP